MSNDFNIKIIQINIIDYKCLFLRCSSEFWGMGILKKYTNYYTPSSTLLLRRRHICNCFV